MLFTIFTHIQPYQRVFIIKHKFSQGFGQFGFTYTEGPIKMKDPIGRRGSLSPERERRMASAIGMNGFTLDQLFVRVSGLPSAVIGRFSLHHLVDRNASPLRIQLRQCHLHRQHHPVCVLLPIYRVRWKFTSEAQPFCFFVRSTFIIPASCQLCSSSAVVTVYFSFQSFRSGGMEYKATRNFAAASSIRSIALSGK